MTAAMMLELLSSKTGVFAAETQHGTAFKGRRVEDMSYVHVRNGYSYSGQEFVTSRIMSKSLPACLSSDRSISRSMTLPLPGLCVMLGFLVVLGRQICDIAAVSILLGLPTLLDNCVVAASRRIVVGHR